MTTLFTTDHEWLRIEGDVATIGVTDYAQSQLGDVVFVELPKVGRSLKKAEAAAVVVALLVGPATPGGIEPERQRLDVDLLVRAHRASRIQVARSAKP